jgi:small subunit ribosomal protein S20
MANIKSAIKRNRQAAKSQIANRSVKSRIRTARAKLDHAAQAGVDGAQADKLFAEYSSVLDKAAKKGTINSRCASRRKSRAAKKLAALRTSSA